MEIVQVHRVYFHPNRLVPKNVYPSSYGPEDTHCGTHIVRVHNKTAVGLAVGLA